MLFSKNSANFCFCEVSKSLKFLESSKRFSLAFFRDFSSKFWRFLANSSSFLLWILAKLVKFCEIRSLKFLKELLTSSRLWRAVW